jgi:hypothetical protein
MIDRERKVDVTKLPEDQVDALSIQIGDKVRGIVDEAADRINKILAVYGMSAKIAIAYEIPEGSKFIEQDPKPAPKKRGRKPKQ